MKCTLMIYIKRTKRTNVLNSNAFFSSWIKIKQKVKKKQKLLILLPELIFNPKFSTKNLPQKSVVLVFAEKVKIYAETSL